MKLTPFDLSQQEFARRLNGYDAKEVKEFLAHVREDYESSLRENQSQAEEIKSLRRELNSHLEREEMLKETLKAAQQLTHGMQSSAQKEIEAILCEARVRAQEILNGAQLRAVEVMDTIQELKRQKVIFETNYKALLDSHFKMLDMTREDPLIVKIEDKVDFLARKMDKKGEQKIG